ncbi:carbohydrate ABC transporter permease [Paenibacillaceae bacterium WGS1546]|uniref:carbohydrate ABC transporter permease n=1 Tax=Cohnella sp. WGS1546 TaxID=3366810 RepID=UPI00372D326F
MPKWVRLARNAMLGNAEKLGIFKVLLIYFVLVNIVFLYLNPLLHMFSTMVKSTADLLDPTVRWIPRAIDLTFLKQAWFGIRFPETFKNSMIIAGFGAVFHVISCSITGYGFARFRFPGRNVLFGVLIVCFLVPPATLTLPMYILFSKLGLLGSPLAIILPALFAHGIRGTLFVIIFRQFFQTVPKAYEEAAYLDGAGSFRIFYKLMLPLAKPAIIVVFIFSFVWHWNETFLTGLFLRGEHMPLSFALDSLWQELERMYGAGGYTDNESMKMAGSFYVILPPMVLYLLVQKWFMRGVEKSGIVE